MKPRVNAELLGALHQLVAEALPRHSVELHAYGFGRTKTILLLTPKTGAAMSRLVQDVCRRLAAQVRRSIGPAGPLLAGRFRSTVLQPERHLIDAMLYAEQLSSRGDELGGDVGRSSAEFHCGAQQDTVITDHPLYWVSGNTPFEREARYKERLAEPLDGATLRQIERALIGGWPLGDDDFLKSLALEMGRPLVPRSPGRPKAPRRRVDQ